MSYSSRCAACKYLRRRCPEDCVLAPYFPSNNPQRFACVHKIFGTSNVSRMLQRLPVHFRADAADCLAQEASLRVQDPVYGCVGIISQLQHQITMVESELTKTRGEIAFYNARQVQEHRQEQQQMARTEGEPSSFNANQNQEDFIYFDQQHQQAFLDFSHLHDSN